MMPMKFAITGALAIATAAGVASAQKPAHDLPPGRVYAFHSRATGGCPALIGTLCCRLVMSWFTYFGHIARSLAGEQEETSFDRGIKQFTWLMIRFMLVMVPLVFLINGLTKHDWQEAFFFSLAVAVGLTPEMLPMIVSVCLSKGAMAMSRKKVIVKRLNAIQNFGAMDVLCTDKTGTLTMDHIILELHCDIHKEESEEVLRDAYLISHFQTGLKNVLDRAVLKYTELHEELSLEKYRKVDEIPFDFSRRMMSVVVDGPDGERQLLTKGAPEAVFNKCAHFEYEGEIFADGADPGRRPPRGTE